MDAQRRRALSDFYREEFLRHLEALESHGLIDATRGGEGLGQAYDRMLAELDRICWRSDFPALAERLLEHFETLTRLSALDPRRRH